MTSLVLSWQYQAAFVEQVLSPIREFLVTANLYMTLHHPYSYGAMLVFDVVLRQHSWVEELWLPPSSGSLHGAFWYHEY